MTYPVQLIMKKINYNTDNDNTNSGKNNPSPSVTVHSVKILYKMIFDTGKDVRCEVCGVRHEVCGLLNPSMYESLKKIDMIPHLRIEIGKYKQCCQECK